MAYYRRGWDDGLQQLAEWWDAVAEYAASEGGAKLPEDFHRRNRLLCEFIKSVAKMDPLTIWELGHLIERSEGIVGSRQDGTDYYATEDPHATISDIVNAVYRAVPLKDQLFASGVTKKKVGRPKSASTLAAERLIAEGKDTDQITQRLGTSAANVRQIRSRTRRKS